jgi:hypothetical protein
MEAISLHHSFNKSKQGERGALHHSDTRIPHIASHAPSTQHLFPPHPTTRWLWDKGATLASTKRLDTGFLPTIHPDILKTKTRLGLTTLDLV